MHNTLFKQPLKYWSLPCLSGLLIGTSYIPFPPWASLFCFVPLWIFWTQQSDLKAVVRGGFITAFIFTLIGFNWVTFLLHEFAHLDWPIAVLGMLVYALVAHLYVPVAGAFWFLGQRTFKWSPLLSLGILTLTTVLCEANSLTLFDWNFGYSWYGANFAIYQWAEVIGFSGLSALTLIYNLPLYLAWQKRQKFAGKMLLALVLVSFVLLNLGGSWLKNRLPAPDAKFNVLLVQASIDNEDKMAAELGKSFRNEIFSRYLTLTDDALKAHPNAKIDFAVWPETAFPGLMGDKFQAGELPTILAQFLDARQLALLTGAYSADQSSGLITNSLFVLNSNGEIAPPHYSKSILLAFGEYIPGEQFLPAIRDWLPATGHFARGQGPTELLRLDDYKIGAQICYESLFPAFSRAIANLGAQFIVNVTNDSWYGNWQEPYQHLYMTLARGVEFRRPVIRATNTGISTAALASGEILAQSPLYQPWAGVYTVPYLRTPPSTFYQRWFWLVPSLLWASFLTLFLFGLRQPKYH